MSAFLISIPHCESRVSDEILSDFALDKDKVLQSKDFGAHEIFGSIPVPIIEAEFSRLVVDLNRDPKNKSSKGVIAKTDYNGQQIYKPLKYPDQACIIQLVKKYFRPYHEKIEKAFAKSDIKFLFDCHSLESIGPKDAPDAGKKRKDITLSNNGDMNGNPSSSKNRVSCPLNIIMFIKSTFEHYGFSVSINNPYKGGYTTTHYGSMYNKKDALQIEINQNLFMSPGDIVPDDVKMKDVRAKVLSVFKEFSDYFS